MVKGQLRNPENADKICEVLASVDGGLNEAARQVGCDAAAILKWRDTDPEFGQRYAHAYELGLEVQADALLAIADTPMIGEKVKTLPNGDVEVTTGDMIEHRRLRVDTRKWLLSKRLPKLYGDKIDVTSNGETIGKALVGIDVERDI